jgi:glycosyltransferase involved in cell wall biosynthesis
MGPPAGPAGPIVVVIPAYNEAENLPHVVRALPAAVCGRALVPVVSVDGATDRTAEVARALGCRTVVSPMRRGGGAALRRGFEAAVAAGAAVVVTMDADGQHQPAEIERLVRPILAGQADLVVGSRTLGRFPDGPPLRRLGLALFNRLVGRLAGRPVSDCASGFRALSVEALGRLSLVEDRFHTAELLIEAARRGCRIVEVPATIGRRLSGASKKPPALLYACAFAGAAVRAWRRGARA